MHACMQKQMPLLLFDWDVCMHACMHAVLLLFDWGVCAGTGSSAWNYNMGAVDKQQVETIAKEIFKRRSALKRQPNIYLYLYIYIYTFIYLLLIHIYIYICIC